MNFNHTRIFFILFSLLMYNEKFPVEAVDSDDELFSVNIYGATTYSSSSALGSSSEYSVDEDFMYKHPTCFQTDPQQPDLNGYHWLIIDFGIVMHHVKEIRLAPNPSHKDYATKLSNTDVYLIQSGESSETDEMIASLRKSRRESPRQINWNSKGIHFCQSTGNISAGTRAASIECAGEMHGRWLALRRLEGELNICLINVYVKKAFEECFIGYSKKEQLIWPSLSGQPFSFIRHLSKSACRAGCSANRNCQAIRYKKMRRTGVCEQIRDVILSEDLVNNTMNGSSQFAQDSLINCESEDCTIALNKCHLGKLHELHRVVTPQRNESTESVFHEDSDYNGYQSENKFSLWEMKSDHQTAHSNSMEPGFLLSVQMDGYLYCSEAICDTLKVYSVDENNEAVLCGEIDSLVVSHLSKYYLFCQNNYSVDKMKSIRLEWNNRGRENTGYLHVNVTQMFVRITQNSKLFDFNMNPDFIPVTTHATTTTTTETNFVREPEWIQHQVKEKNEQEIEQPKVQEPNDRSDGEEKKEEGTKKRSGHIQQEAELLQQYYQHENEERLHKNHDRYSSEQKHQQNESEEINTIGDNTEETSDPMNWLNSNTDYGEDEEDEVDTSNFEVEDDKRDNQVIETETTKQVNSITEGQTEFTEQIQDNTKSKYIITTESNKTIQHNDKADHQITNSWELKSSSHNLPKQDGENYEKKNMLSAKLGVREARREQDDDRDNYHKTKVSGKNHRNLERKSLLTPAVYDEKKMKNSSPLPHNPTLFLIFLTHLNYILIYSAFEYSS
ncbi:unnamed protein product [Trichobilharzia szidati]|nr:unnamed protein product [Trichobilharzia szidati]